MYILYICNVILYRVIAVGGARNSAIDKIRPPEAHLIGDPPVSKPRETVNFDASKSKDMYGGPCVSFLWDFGDGSPNKTTRDPYTTHPYQEIGNYPVTVTVTDKNGLKANASVNQQLIFHNIPTPNPRTPVPQTLSISAIHYQFNLSPISRSQILPHSLTHDLFSYQNT